MQNQAGELNEPLLAPGRTTRRCLTDRILLGSVATLAIAIVALGVLSASPVKSSLSWQQQPEVLSLATRPTVEDGAAKVEAVTNAPSAARAEPAVSLASTKFALVPASLSEAPVVTVSATRKEAETCAEGFPTDFMWGLGTAAYQIEGGVREMG